MYTRKQWERDSYNLAAGIDRATEKGTCTLMQYLRDERTEYQLTDDGLLGKHLKEYTFTTPPSTLNERTRLALAESDEIPERSGPLEEEQGNDGTNYQSGRPYRGKHREHDQPLTWRGLRTDYGNAHNIYLTSPVYQRPVNSAMQTVCSGIWEVRPAEVDEELAEAAELQAGEVQKAVDALDSGLNQFLTEAVYSLTVPGFGVWLRIHHEDGRLKRLAFRRPNTIDRVILNESESQILALKFITTDGGEYIVDIRDCLILTSNKIGTDIEGLSPFRSVVEYVRAKQLAVERFMLSVEKHGTPQDIVEATEDYTEDTGDAELVADVLDARRSDDPKSIILPKGLSVKTLSPAGAFPPVIDFIRLCDEYISMPLSSEGALLGAGKTGSYALAETKDDQSLRVAVYIAQVIAIAFNGHDNSPSSGPLRSMVDAMGGPVAPGAYPELTFSLGEEEVPLADIQAAATQGLITITPEVQDHIHERLKLPVVVREETEATAEAALLNGAQAQSVVNIITQVMQGLLPADSAVKILETAFLIPSVTAESMVAPARMAATPQVEQSTADVTASECCPAHTVPHVDETAGNLFADFDVDDANDAHDRTNAAVGKAFERLAKRHRAAWVERTRGLTSPTRVIELRDAFRQEWMPQYREAALPAINELRAKGGLSIAREIGAIPKVPKSIKDAPTTASTLQLADSVALRSYNTVEAYLLERTTLELNGAPERAFPPIPSQSAFASHAAAGTAAAFSQGRDEVVKELIEASKRGAPPGKEPRIIAEYSSVLDGNTCDPCGSADGRRVFVGSRQYRQLMPPSVCDGGNRCRCIFSYIMPDEADYAEIFEEVASGFSQTGNTQRFNEDVMPWGLVQFARLYRAQGDA
jgi:hypothetical protein